MAEIKLLGAYAHGIEIEIEAGVMGSIKVTVPRKTVSDMAALAQDQGDLFSQDGTKLQPPRRYLPVEMPGDEKPIDFARPRQPDPASLANMKAIYLCHKGDFEEAAARIRRRDPSGFEYLERALGSSFDGLARLAGRGA